MNLVERMYCWTVGMPVLWAVLWRLFRGDTWECRWGRRFMAAWAAVVAPVLVDAWVNGLDSPLLWQRLWWKLT